VLEGLLELEVVVGADVALSREGTVEVVEVDVVELVPRPPAEVVLPLP